jgi:hypothetical protein
MRTTLREQLEHLQQDMAIQFRRTADIQAELDALKSVVRRRGRVLVDDVRQLGVGFAVEHRTNGHRSK